MGSGRTRGTKITESSSESLTMNMKPSLNIQVAAAVSWSVFLIILVYAEAAVGLHVTPDCSPGGKRVLEACDWRSAGKVCGEFEEGRRCSGLEEGTGSGVVRSLLAPGSEEDNGGWALTSDRLPSPRPVQSHSGMAGRVRAVLSSRNKLRLDSRTSLPQVLYLEKRSLMASPSKRSE